jgi:hypothetical protein
MEPLIPRGLCYVNWDFGVPLLDGVEMDFTIHSPMECQPGMYLQLHDGGWGDVGGYFGLQTDVVRPGIGFHGKGLLFSRWGNCSQADARPMLDGWLEHAGHEGNFVGVRRAYSWGVGRYCAAMKLMDRDTGGDWFGLTVRDVGTGVETNAGLLRFPSGARLNNNGGTWIECYSGVSSPAGFPFLHVTVNSAIALIGHDRIPAVHARSTYATYPGVTQFDVVADGPTKCVDLKCGRGVSPSRPAGMLF